MSLRLFAACLAAAISLTAADGGATGARAGTWRKDAREISRSDDNVVLLSDCVYRSDRALLAQVRVEFQRLSGLAAGALAFTLRPS